MASEQPAPPSEFRPYRRFVSWFVLIFVSLGSAYLLVSVGRDDLPPPQRRPAGRARRRDRVDRRPRGLPRGADRRRAGAGAPPRELPPPARALRRRRGPALGRGPRRSGSASGRPPASAATSAEPRTGPLAKEWEELGVIHAELRDTEASYTKELLRFGTEPGATPRSHPRADSTSVGRRIGSRPSPRPAGATHHDRHAFGRLGRHRHERRHRHSNRPPRRRPPRRRRRRPTPPPPRRRPRAPPSPSWACTPTCCAPSRRWASPSRCRCRRRPSRSSSTGRDLMVQSRTGSGKTAAFGIPFAQRHRRRRDDKFVQAHRAAADARAGAAGRRRAGADLRTHREHHGRAGLRRRADGPPDRAAARRRADRRAARRAACSTTCGRGTLRPRPRALRRARRVRRDAVDGLPGGHRGDPRAHARRRGRRCCSRRRCPRGSSAIARRYLRNARVPQAVGRLHRRARDPARLLLDPAASQRETRAAAHPRRSRSRSRRSSSATRARRPARGRRVPAQAGPRRRGDLVGPVAERSRARAWGACARAASSSWSRPTSPRAASTSRTCRTSSTTRSPRRPRSTSTAPAAPAAPASRGPRSR